MSLDLQFIGDGDRSASDVVQALVGPFLRVPEEDNLLSNENLFHYSFLLSFSQLWALGLFLPSRGHNGDNSTF